MSRNSALLLYALAAGLPIFAGALLGLAMPGKLSHRVSEIRHWVVAFGGGALLSAVAFALLPPAMESLGAFPLAFWFLSGTAVFLTMDWLAQKSAGSVAQVLSMLLDFIPETLALGATFAEDPRGGLALCLFIGLQNLPEGFNSFQELKPRLGKPGTLVLLFVLSFVGIAGAWTGQALLTGKPEAIGAMLLVAGGGILYLVFQDIAPQAKRRHDGWPATGASCGFLLGMLGERLLGG